MFGLIARLGAPSLVNVVESTYRQESMLIARRMAAVATLLRLRRREAAAARDAEQHDYAEIDGFHQAAAEVAAVLNMSAMAAGYLVSDADALDTRLPRVAELLAQGRADWRTVQLIIRRTELVVDAALMATLDTTLATEIGGWRSWSRRRILNAVDAAVTKVDPDAVRENRGATQEDRCVGFNAGDNGMADLYGTVSATTATAFDRRLAQMAKGVCGHDPRTLDQRRADALGALAKGRRLRCECGRTDCPANTRSDDSARDPGGVKIIINVVASEDTVRGTGSAPGYLEGFGVIAARQVRELADDTFLHVIDPVARAAEALRYQPGAGLERAVRCRDLTCRFPGCSREAVYCDVDHTVPFDHQNPSSGGSTVLENLKCLCRLHHRLKTFGGWHDRQLPDGTVIWTSPAGRTYTTVPAGADLFPALGRPACGAPAPTTRTRAQQRAKDIAAARKHNREQRPINEYNSWLQSERAQEIEHRKFRNHMRDMLFTFKGGEPSTSPLGTWVNDAREPEELPPDWVPAEPMPDQISAEPPF